MTTARQQTVTTQEQEQTRAAWDSIAAGYDVFVTPAHLWLASEALQRVGLRPRMRFLDVAAGSGALSIPAARLGAQVLAVDLSPAMIERLEARARDEGLSNLEAKVMDGHALELEDDTFDAAGSQFGIMLFPDLAQGLHEMARVTKPGGRVLMVTFGLLPTLEFLGFFMGAMQAAVPGFSGFPGDSLPLPCQVGDPEVLRSRMFDAGLRDVKLDTVDFTMEFRTGAEFYDLVTHSNPIGAALVADLTEQQRAEVRQVLDGMLRERSHGGIAVLHNAVHIAVGTK
jgi:ubiquinone/menaquinone biosynthesis C-methylase UbiE